MAFLLKILMSRDADTNKLMILIIINSVMVNLTSTHVQYKNRVREPEF